jgi:hypothetical protein
VKNSKARVRAKKLKKSLGLSLQISNDSEYLQVDSPEKPSGFAEVDGRRSCGAGCGHTPARLAANAVLLTGKKVASGKSVKICLAKNYGSVIIREIYEKHLLLPRSWARLAHFADRGRILHICRR